MTEPEQPPTDPTDDPPPVEEPPAEEPPAEEPPAEEEPPPPPPVTHPPVGWTRLPGADVANNASEPVVDQAVAGQLADGGHWSTHTARQFIGCVWFTDGLWHNRVTVGHRPRATYTGADLDDLVQLVNDTYGVD